MLKSIQHSSILAVCLVLISTQVFAQLTPNFPANQGGFQQGTTLSDNGWTAVNGNAINGWTIGGNYPGATDGRCAYVSNDLTASNSAATVGAISGQQGQVVNLFRTITLPATDSAIFLRFRYAANHISTHGLSIMIDTLPYPALTGFTTGAPIWNLLMTVTGGFISQVAQIPPAFAGKQVRLRFESIPPATLPANVNSRGIAIDDVMIETRPFLNTMITAKAAGGNWADTSTWVGGIVPSAGEDVLINQGTTVVANLTGVAGAQNLVVVGTLQGTVPNGTPQGVIQASRSVAVSGNMLIRDRVLRIGSDLTAFGNGLIDLRRGSLAFDSSGYNFTRNINLNSMSQFQDKCLSGFICNAPEGLQFILGTSNDTLKVYRNVTLGAGQIKHNGRLLIDNTIAASLAGVTNPATVSISIQRGSFDTFPMLGANANLDLRYSHTATNQAPLLMGSRNEVPANWRIGRLTVGTAFSFLRIPNDLWLTDNSNTTLTLFGPTIVEPGKRVVMLNTAASTGVFTANQGLLQGKLVYTLNSGSAITKRYPVGRNGIANHVELRGITTAGEAKIGVEAVQAATAGIVSPLTALSPIARIRVTLDSGTVSGITQVGLAYTVADGIATDQIGRLRIGTSATLNGNYTSIGPSTAPTASPVVSNTGSFATNAFYTLALEGGAFRKLWTGAAGDNSWDTPENWSGNTLPSCADSVVLAPQFVTIKLAGDQQVGGLEVGSQTTLELQSGARLRVGCTPGTGRLLINGFGGSGHIYGIKALPGSTLRVE